MKKGKFRRQGTKRYILRRLCWWTLVCLWCALAAYLSRQTGAQTTALSLRLTDFVEDILARVGAALPERLSGGLEGILPETLVALLRGGSVRRAQLHMFLRKAAHVGVYLVLGFLLMRAEAASFAARGRGQLWGTLPALLLGGGVAVADEVQKYAIPGRHCDWSEVLLNCQAAAAGVLAGLILGALTGGIAALIRRRRETVRRRAEQAACLARAIDDRPDMYAELQKFFRYAGPEKLCRDPAEILNN